MAVRPYQSRAIVGRVVGERPHHIDEIFGAADLPPPPVLIPMRQLRQRAGMNRDGLRQVELDGVAPWRQYPLGDAENRLLLEEQRRQRRARQQPPETFGTEATEIRLDKGQPTG